MEHSLQRLFHPLLLTRPEPFDKAEGASAPAGLLECPRVHATRPLASRACRISPARSRSEEHTSELQSLMRISYAVFCLKKKNYTIKPHKTANKKHTTTKSQNTDNTTSHAT